MSLCSFVGVIFSVCVHFLLFLYIFFSTLGGPSLPPPQWLLYLKNSFVVEWIACSSSGYSKMCAILNQGTPIRALVWYKVTSVLGVIELFYCQRWKGITTTVGALTGSPPFCRGSLLREHTWWAVLSVSTEPCAVVYPKHSGSSRSSESRHSNFPETNALHALSCNPSYPSDSV